MFAWLRRIFGVDDAPETLTTPRAVPVPPPAVPPLFRIGVVGIPSPELLSALASAIEKSALVRIVYHGGSRPGSIRDVHPLSLTSDSLLATDIAEGIDKTFRLERLEIAPEGAPVTPRAKIPPIHGVAPNPDDRAPERFTVEVMRRSYQKDMLARMIGSEPWPGGILTPARCIPGGDDGGVQVEINGAVIGALYSKYWWHYRVTIGDVVTECRALITGPGHDVMLDLVLPTLATEIAEHYGRVYECEVMGDSKSQPVLRQIFRKRAAEKPAAWVPLVTAQLLPGSAELPGVRVAIEGQIVGYLGKANARKYLKVADPPKSVPAYIAEIDSGWEGRKRYTVQLSLVL